MWITAIHTLYAVMFCSSLIVGMVIVDVNVCFRVFDGCVCAFSLGADFLLYLLWLLNCSCESRPPLRNGMSHMEGCTEFGLVEIPQLLWNFHGLCPCNTGTPWGSGLKL